MNKETREIVALTEKWLEKIREITVGYEKSISVLAQARADYEAQKTKWYKTLLPYLFALLTLIVVLIVAGIILRSSCPNPVDINFEGLAISQHCTHAK